MTLVGGATLEDDYMMLLALVMDAIILFYVFLRGDGIYYCYCYE
jgi:hypothetical protein